ncbi:MAG: hypothetical protein N4A61_06525 [Pelagimonas sp.]|jgi:transcriptional regulator with AAA-type ATPase domain|nr:hypothetical protein [Pelagimonas sp.]
MIRKLALLACVALLAGCAASVTQDLKGPVKELGDFKLGHSEVVAPNLEKLLVSREATAEEWTTVMDTALEERFRRFEGDRFYHLGVSVEAYSMPPPFVPGKSALALRVTLWDDETQVKMNEETNLIHIIQVFESRLNLTREEQMKRLAELAAREVENWLREQMDTQRWFVMAQDAAQEEASEDVEEASEDAEKTLNAGAAAG